MEKQHWNNVEELLPLAWDTGHWDGKKTDQLLVQDENGNYHIATYYEFDDNYTEWYDNHDSTLRYKIIRWMEIPQY